MTNQLELNLRAALCRQLAKREPANRSLWLAEAENWVRLSDEKLQRRTDGISSSGYFWAIAASFPEGFGLLKACAPESFGRRTLTDHGPRHGFAWDFKRLEGEFYGRAFSARTPCCNTS